MCDQCTNETDVFLGVLKTGFGTRPWPALLRKSDWVASEKRLGGAWLISVVVTRGSHNCERGRTESRTPHACRLLALSNLSPAQRAAKSMKKDHHADNPSHFQPDLPLKFFPDAPPQATAGTPIRSCISLTSAQGSDLGFSLHFWSSLACMGQRRPCMACGNLQLNVPSTRRAAQTHS